MKSLLSLLGAALCLAAALALYLYQSGSGQVATLFGKPALEEGTPLYPIVKKAIAQITIQADGEEPRTYTRGLSYWSTTSKGQKVRADYAKLDQLLTLLETTTVQQEVPQNSALQSQLNPVSLTLTNDDGLSFTTTLLGALPRYTGLEPPLAPSFAVRYQDGRTYACTSALLDAYPDLSARALIDHRPFFFHPDLLQTLSYKSGNQLITLTRPTAEQDWTITSPLNLRTDPAAVKALIDQLYTTEAAQLSEEQSPTAPAPATLTLTSFTDEIPAQTLQLYGAKAFDAASPFCYQLSPDQITAITPDVDQLRSKILAGFTVDQLNTLLLQSRTQSTPVTLAILPTRTGAPRWMYQTYSQWLPATETGVADLLAALTKDPVQGFTLDTLASPADADKSITVDLKDGSTLHFDLFRTAEHNLIQRRGDDFSAILSNAHARKIQTEPSTWKDNQLWEVSAITLKGVQRQVTGRPLENYSYNFNLEQWKGQIGSASIDEDVDLVSANAFLNLIEGLRVSRWISPSSALSSIGTSAPVAELLLLSQRFTQDGDPDGLDTKTLTLYRMPGNNNQVIACLQEPNTAKQYGLLEKPVALQLIKPLVYQD